MCLTLRYLGYPSGVLAIGCTRRMRMCAYILSNSVACTCVVCGVLIDRDLRSIFMIQDIAMLGVFVYALFVIFTLTLSIVLLAALKWRGEDGKGRVAVIVLGDLGRSPRMQYHALSLCRESYEVEFVGYGGINSIRMCRCTFVQDASARVCVCVCVCVFRTVCMDVHL